MPYFLSLFLFWRASWLFPCLLYRRITESLLLTAFSPFFFLLSEILLNREFEMIFLREVLTLSSRLLASWIFHQFLSIDHLSSPFTWWVVLISFSVTKYLLSDLWWIMVVVYITQRKKKSIHDKHSPCSLLLMTQPDGHWVILSDAALTNPVFTHSILWWVLIPCVNIRESTLQWYWHSVFSSKWVKWSDKMLKFFL